MKNKDLIELLIEQKILDLISEIEEKYVILEEYEYDSLINADSLWSDILVTFNDAISAGLKVSELDSYSFYGMLGQVVASIASTAGPLGDIIAGFAYIGAGMAYGAAHKEATGDAKPQFRFLSYIMYGVGAVTLMVSFYGWAKKRGIKRPPVPSATKARMIARGLSVSEKSSKAIQKSAIQAFNSKTGGSINSGLFIDESSNKIFYDGLEMETITASDGEVIDTGSGVSYSFKDPTAGPREKQYMRLSDVVGEDEYSNAHRNITNLISEGRSAFIEKAREEVAKIASKRNELIEANSELDSLVRNLVDIPGVSPDGSVNADDVETIMKEILVMDMDDSGNRVLKENYKSLLDGANAGLSQIGITIPESSVVKSIENADQLSSGKFVEELANAQSNMNEITNTRKLLNDLEVLDRTGEVPDDSFWGDIGLFKKKNSATGASESAAQNTQELEYMSGYTSVQKNSLRSFYISAKKIRRHTIDKLKAEPIVFDILLSPSVRDVPGVDTKSLNFLEVEIVAADPRGLMIGKIKLKSGFSEKLESLKTDLEVIRGEMTNPDLTNLFSLSKNDISLDAAIDIESVLKPFKKSKEEINSMNQVSQTAYAKRTEDTLRKIQQYNNMVAEIEEMELILLKNVPGRHVAIDGKSYSNQTSNWITRNYADQKIADDVKNYTSVINSLSSDSSLAKNMRKGSRVILLSGVVASAYVKLGVGVDANGETSFLDIELSLDEPIYVENKDKTQSSNTGKFTITADDLRTIDEKVNEVTEKAIPLDFSNLQDN